MIESNERLLTAREVRDRLRLLLSTVYYLAKEGKLRGFRVGWSWRFPMSEINRIMQVEAVPDSKDAGFASTTD